MQQVTAHSRFWWRALDAYPPEPRNAPPPPAVAPWPFQPKQRPAAASVPLAAAPAPLTLEIPKADRRPPRRRALRRKGRLGRAVLSVAALLSCSAAAAAAFVAGTIEPQRIQILMSAQARDVLLELGFGIDQVSLTGHRYTPDSDIYAALELDKARTFAEFDAEAALRRLEGLPWVDTAQITRTYPSMLSVSIRERKPAVVWALKGRTFVVDGAGRVLGATGSPEGWHLPRISGEEANVEAAALFAALSRHPDIASTLAIAERIGGRRWSLHLSNGSRLELGADRELEGLSQIAANSMLRKALAGPAMIADVRTPGRPALRPATALAGRGVVAP